MPLYVCVCVCGVCESVFAWLVECFFFVYLMHHLSVFLSRSGATNVHVFIIKIISFYFSSAAAAAHIAL